MSKILVMTGATGSKSGGAFAECISQHIDTVKTLFPDGIRALVRETSDTSVLEKKIADIEIKRGNFEDMEFLEKVLIGVDTLVHIAGINLSKPLVAAAVKAGVRRLILVHTTGIYSKYKAAGEAYRKIDSCIYKVCRERNIGLTILRPTMIYGNITDSNVCVFIRMVDKFKIMPVVNGAKYELQPVHYKDLGNAYYQVLIHEEETWNHDYNLSGGRPIYLRDMFTEIGKNLGKQVKFFSVAYPIAYAGAVVLWVLTLKKKDFREKVQRLCEPRIFSHEEATKDFGYNPVDFREGIVDEVTEYKKANNKI